MSVSHGCRSSLLLGKFRHLICWCVERYLVGVLTSIFSSQKVNLALFIAFPLCENLLLNFYSFLCNVFLFFFFFWIWRKLPPLHTNHCWLGTLWISCPNFFFIYINFYLNSKLEIVFTLILYSPKRAPKITPPLLIGYNKCSLKLDCVIVLRREDGEEGATS